MDSLVIVEEMIGKNPEHIQNYMRMVDLGMLQGRQSYIEQVRYMLALAHTAESLGFSKEYMFIGGLGVLGNIVNELGIDSITKWRGTRDLDVALYDRSKSSLVDIVFDEIDIAGKSSSIPNKSTVRGYSLDSNCNPLGSATIDVYFPNGSPKQGVKIRDVVIDDSCWESPTRPSFFGLLVNCADPITLMKMKLHVENDYKLCRTQDALDIIVLTGVCERREISPLFLNQLLSREKERKVLQYSLRNPPSSLITVEGALPLPLVPSSSYIEELLQ
ncbi:MAG TPA: hypothetical protein VJK51_02625 [Candidatus Nanoarchaeia archaeon]|nr:hypothetical protein [Candidatus Nanoarchaeia archaeon]